MLPLLELLAHLFRYFIICKVKEAFDVLAAILRFLLITPFFGLNSKAGNQPVLAFNWDLNWVFGALIINEVIVVIIDELE